jgi:hypothetical protein
MDAGRGFITVWFVNIDRYLSTYVEVLLMKPDKITVLSRFITRRIRKSTSPTLCNFNPANIMG